MMQGEVEKDGLKHLIILTDAEFIYRVKPKNGVLQDHGFTNIWNMENIPLQRILSVGKKVKHLKENQDSFTINYVGSIGNGDLEIRKAKFKGDVETCARFREKIRKSVNERYPNRKYLVLINPVSGKGNAKSVFRRKVEPVLAMGGIITEVVVTEKSKHAVELAKTYDLSGIQGVVVVGGDGFVSECVTGLLVRVQMAAGIDHNDPESVIKPAPLPIGIIPAGSGDYIVQYLHGTRDPVTAAIHIVLGNQEKANVAGIFKGGQLCAYSGLLMGFGLIGDIMKDLEQHRWLGAARFNIVPVRSVINRRMLDLEVDYLTDEWQTINRSAYGIDAHVVTLRPEKSKMAPCFGDSSISMYITSKCKLSEHIKQLGKVSEQTTDCWNYQFVDQHQVQGFRVRLPKATKLHTPTGEAVLAHNYYLNSDGEVISIDKPQFEVRLHREVLSLFGDISLKTQQRNHFVWYTETKVTEL